MIRADQRGDPVADDQVVTQVIRPRRHLPAGDRRLAEVIEERRAHIEEDPITQRAQQERHVLVGPVAAYAKSIDRPGGKRLAPPVERAKMLTQSEQRFLGPQRRRQPVQASCITGREVVIGAPNVPVFRLLEKPRVPRRIDQVQAVRVSVDLEHGLRRVETPARRVLFEAPFDA